MLKFLLHALELQMPKLATGVAGTQIRALGRPARCNGRDGLEDTSLRCRPTLRLLPLFVF